MPTLIETFIQELKYSRNVSEPTLGLYGWPFKAFQGAIENRESVLKRVAELRDRGLQAVTANTYIRHINCYYNWLHKEHSLSSAPPNSQGGKSTYRNLEGLEVR